MEIEKPSENTLIRYFRGQGLPHEIELITLYLSMDVDHEYIAACMQTAWLNDQDDVQTQVGRADMEDFIERFHQRKNELYQLPPVVRRRPFFRSLRTLPAWIKAAAAVLILVGTSLLVANFNAQTDDQESTQNRAEILPGTNKATLTLADGSRVQLSNQPAGRLALQDGLAVEKTGNGEIRYRMEKPATVATAINTISTPKGGQYQVILPDGTKAYLNAASSLSYPLQFKKGERRVKMTGEIYFEVAKVLQPHTGKRQPFFVETTKQEVQVLGTHFNVKAYADEPQVRTTLVEGSVKVRSYSGQSALLRPGQLLVLSDQLKIVQADMDQEMAWRNGDFIFKGETLESALRQISRWYNVEIDCSKKLGQLRFNGMISRKQPLSTIINMIQLTKKAKVTVKERRLIVTE